MGAVALVLPALPPGPAVDQDRPEVIDDHLVRSGEHLDAFLARHRRGAGVGDRGDRAVREPQRQRNAVVALGRVPAQDGDRVLDGGVRERLGQVDEMAHLAEQAAALAPVEVPVAVGDPASGDPVDDQLGRLDLGQHLPRGLHGGRPAPVEAERELAAGVPPGLLHLVEVLAGQRQRLLAPHVPPGGQGLAGQVGVHLVRGGDHDHADIRVVDDGGGAGDRLLEPVPFGRPPRGDAAGGGHGHETLEAGVPEGGQQRAGGKGARPDPAHPGLSASDRAGHLGRAGPQAHRVVKARRGRRVRRGRVGQADGQAGLVSPAAGRPRPRGRSRTSG